MRSARAAGRSAARRPPVAASRCAATNGRYSRKPEITKKIATPASKRAKYRANGRAPTAPVARRDVQHDDRERGDRTQPVEPAQAGSCARDRKPAARSLNRNKGFSIRNQLALATRSLDTSATTTVTAKLPRKLARGLARLRRPSAPLVHLLDERLVPQVDAVVIVPRYTIGTSRRSAADNAAILRTEDRRQQQEERREAVEELLLVRLAARRPMQKVRQAGPERTRS